MGVSGYWIEDVRKYFSLDRGLRESLLRIGSPFRVYVLFIK